MIAWPTLTEQEGIDHRRCVRRAVEHFSSYNRLDCEMDLLAAHSTCPLDFAKLADFPDADFWHDILGVRKYLDRSSGELTSCFVPRCSR